MNNLDNYYIITLSNTHTNMSLSFVVVTFEMVKRKGKNSFNNLCNPLHTKC